MPYLPMTREEAGNKSLDVILVTGDAYVDHPSWGVAAIGRWLEAHGFTVGVIAQPDWDDPEAFRVLGKPNLFFGITAGNMDTMVNKYTASRRLRTSDAYSPGGRIGTRPDRATIAYTARARQAYKGVPIVVGGVEASLRRFAHFDFWQEKIRGSILLDAKADLLLYGMAENTIVTLARRLKAGEGVAACRDLPGVCWAPGAKDTLPEGDDVIAMPSLEECRKDPLAFNRCTLLMYRESNPHCGRILVQKHGGRAIVQNKPAIPLETEELDRLHELPFQYDAHPCYREPIPALQSIAGSISVNRGCSGGCSFCALTIHQGKDVTSRSEASVVREATAMGKRPGFKGIISDLGGPTANMFHMRCNSEAANKVCRRVSCLHPVRCKHYGTDHKPYINLLRKVRKLPGIRRVYVNSGIRYDLAALDNEFVEELAAHHVQGQLSVAPEHASVETLHQMRKPGSEYFLDFMNRFKAATKKAGKEQYMVPYFQCAHPGTGPEQTIELALFMKEHGLRPRQVQMFMPTPGTISTAMFVSGVDPYTKKASVCGEGTKGPRSSACTAILLEKRRSTPCSRGLTGMGSRRFNRRHPGALVRPGPAYGSWDRRAQTGKRAIRYDTHMGMKVERATANEQREEAWEAIAAEGCGG